MIRRISFYLIVSLVVISTSCKFQKTLKSVDMEEKYNYAVKLYERKDYSRALQLFDQMVGALRATEKAEQIFYYYAYCYYYQQDYTLASYYFKRFTTTFPTSKRAEECYYMNAYCLYLNSPDFMLDQTTTYDAIKEFQLFVNMYPTSERVSSCNDMIDKLREKLEQKDYHIAKMYYKMKDYSASVTCFGNILKDYPESSHREELMFLTVKSYAKYADESIESKKKERYSKAIQAYNEFAIQFPESKYLAEAKLIKTRSETAMNAAPDKNERLKFNFN